MAQLSSFAVTAANVATDVNTRTITISNEVVDIDGTLDAPTGSTDNWGGWTIVCTSSGGFRFVAGATGTLGGGIQTLKVIETTSAHRYRADNYTQSSGVNRARFFGGTVKVHNVYWLIQGALADSGRSDFDVYRGTNNNGSLGADVEFSGVFLHQLTQSGIQPNHNHMAGNYSIKNHPRLGYGFRIRNETTAHVIEFSTPIQSGKVVEGLIVDNVASPTNHAGDSNARVTVQLNVVPTNGAFTLTDLNAPSITDVSGSSDKSLVLIDPVGQPTITNNWGRHVQFEIRRTQPFTFTGASVPSGTTMNAVAQISGGTDGTATMSGTSGEIVLRTQYASSTALTWTNQNRYRFFMTGLNIQRYARTTNLDIGNTPTAITAPITADVLPDGTGISTITLPTTDCDNLSEIIRILKQWEVDNATLSDAPTVPLVHLDGTDIVINTDYDLVLSRDASEILAVDNSADTITIKVPFRVRRGSDGLTTLDVGGTGKTITETGTVHVDSDVFLKDSTGQNSLLTITNNMGAATRFVLVNTTDGTTTGDQPLINSTEVGRINISAKGLGSTYRLVSKRPGYRWFETDVDLSGGGERTITAVVGTQMVQPDGSASYVSSLSVSDDLTIDVTNTGSTPKMVANIPDETFTARVLFKAFEDALTVSSNAKFMALGGQQVDYIKDAIKGDQIYLGAHTKVKRADAADNNATIRASLFATDDAPVENNSGGVQTIEGLDIPAVATAIITTTDFDPDTAGVQSVWGKLNTIESGGGSTLTAQQVWEYTARSLTSAAGLTATQATQLSNASTKASNTNSLLLGSNGVAAIKTAVDAIPTDSGGGSGPTVIYSRGPERFTITRTAFNTSTREITISAADYANLTSTITKATDRIAGNLRENPSSGSFISSTSIYVKKVDDTNYRVKVYDSLADAEADTDAYYITDNNSVILGFNFQTTGAGIWETPAWQLANKSTGYFKIDTGFAWEGRSNDGFSYGDQDAAQVLVKLQIAYEDTANGDFDTWTDVSDITQRTDNAFMRYYEYFRSRVPKTGSPSYSNYFPLSDLPTVTDGKYIKFRVFYFGDESDSVTAVPSDLRDCYLNITIIDSLGVQVGGATSGGLTSPQALQLTNISNAVTSTEHGNSIIKTAVDGVPADVWTVDLSGTQTDDTAGDLVKEASTNSGGGGGGGASAQQIWEYDTSSITGSKAGAVINTITDSTNGLSAIKTAVNTIDGEVETLDTNIDSIKSDIENSTYGLSAIHDDVANIQVSGIPTANEVRDAVWAKVLTSTESRSAQISPTGINLGFLLLSTADATALPSTVTPITFANVSTYTGITTGTTYYGYRVLFGTDYFFPVYDTEANATSQGASFGSVGLQTIGGSGTPTDIVINLPPTQSQVNVGSANDLVVEIRGDVNSVQTDVEALPSADDNADAVWAHADVPAAAATVGEIADGVWAEEVLSPQYLQISPTGTAVNSVELPVTATNFTSLSAGTAVTMTNTGGYSTVTRNQTYYVWKSAPNLGRIALYTTQAEAINPASLPVQFTGGGTPTDIILTVPSRSVVRRNYGSASTIISNLIENTEEVESMIEAVPDNVWAHADVPAAAATVGEIADAVWAELIEGGLVDDLTITPEARVGTGFQIPADDAALIANGDAFTFTNTGNYGGINTTDTYYAWIGDSGGSKVLYIYATRHNALTPGAAFISVTDGADSVLADVRIVFAEKRPIGSASVVMHRLLEGLVELDANHDAHSATTQDIYSTLTNTLGANWVETGLSLKQAIQLLVGVNAGKLVVSNAGGTFTFHRLDTNETAVLRANASSAGRTGITRDPT